MEPLNAPKVLITTKKYMPIADADIEPIYHLIALGEPSAFIEIKATNST